MLNKNILKKYGFKTDQEGIINRYLREEGGWNTHLEKTKNFILQAAITKQKGIAIVLGSGWLLDVPIEQLATQFEKVVLVDVIHPRQIEHKVKKIANVVLLQTDITGFALPVFELSSKKMNPPKNLSEIAPDNNIQLADLIKKADFVVSVNLLNQLDILICDFIAKLNLYNTEEINLFRKRIQTNHWQLLPTNKSALITDYEELNTDSKNKVIHRKKLIHIELPNEKNAIRWKWSFDSKKTYHTNCKTEFKVLAMEK